MLNSCYKPHANLFNHIKTYVWVSSFGWYTTTLTKTATCLVTTIEHKPHCLDGQVPMERKALTDHDKACSVKDVLWDKKVCKINKTCTETGQVQMYISLNAAGTRQGRCKYTFVKRNKFLVSVYIILTYAPTTSNIWYLREFLDGLWFWINFSTE